jgi:DNA-binding NtrC family response regulator
MQRTPKPPEVWIIDSDHWARACLRAELIERGYDAIGFESAAQAQAAAGSGAGVRVPQVVVVDLADQGEALVGVSAVALRFAQQGVSLVAIGRALARSADVEGPWAVHLHRPITLGQIADAVERLLPSGNR